MCLHILGNTIIVVVSVKSCPNLVKENLSPTWFHSSGPTLLNLVFHQLILDRLWTLATLEQMGVNVLTRRVGGKALGGDWKVFSQSSMAIAVTALESWVSNGSLGASHKSIRFGEPAWLHLAHQIVNIGWNGSLVFCRDNGLLLIAQ